MEHSMRWVTAGAGLGTGVAAALALQKVRRPRMRPLDTAPFVDLNRYAGRWFEIARYPFGKESAEQRNTTAQYSPPRNGRMRFEVTYAKPHGGIAIVHGSARVTDPETNAKLRVKYGRAGGDYWIIEVGDDYSYAIIGEPKRRHVWILSRTPAMDDQVFQQLCRRLSMQGYDPAKLQRTLQE